MNLFPRFRWALPNEPRHGFGRWDAFRFRGSVPVILINSKAMSRQIGWITISRWTCFVEAFRGLGHLRVSGSWKLRRWPRSHRRAFIIFIRIFKREKIALNFDEFNLLTGNDQVFFIVGCASSFYLLGCTNIFYICTGYLRYRWRNFGTVFHYPSFFIIIPCSEFQFVHKVLINSTGHWENIYALRTNIRTTIKSTEYCTTSCKL